MKIVKLFLSVMSISLILSGCGKDVKATYHENGNIKSKTEYSDALKDGMEILYRKNGNKFSETMYKDGKKTGISTLYSYRGEVSHEYDCQGVGEMTGYYTSGQIYQKAECRDGVLHGISDLYSKSGDVIESGTYNKGFYKKAK